VRERPPSSQPNAKGTVIQPEHLFDGRLETILPGVPPPPPPRALAVAGNRSALPAPFFHVSKPDIFGDPL